MSDQRTVPQWMSRGMAIALLALTNPVSAIASMPLLVAQTPAVDCTQERQQVLQSTLSVLQDNFGQEVNRRDFRRAGQTLATMFQRMRSLDLSMRSAHLTTALLEESSQGYGQWQQLLQYAAETGDYTVVTPALSEATQSVESLTSGYSFYKTRLFTELAQTYIEIEQPDQAAQLLEFALQSSQGIRGAEFATKALTPMADAYLALGDVNTALTILRESQVFAEQVNNPTYPTRRGMVLAPIAIAYAQAGEVETAVDLSQRIDNDPYNQGVAQVAIVKAYLSNDDLEAATDLARSLTSSELQAEAIASLGEYAANQGNRSQTLAFFSEALDIEEPDSFARLNLLKRYAAVAPEAALPQARSLSTPEYRVAVLAQIARTYEQSGSMDQATPVLDEMVVALEELPADWQGFEVQPLIDEAIAAGAYQQAIRLTLVPDETYLYQGRAPILREIVRRAAQDGDQDAVQQALAAIPENNAEGRSLALRELAIAQVQDNQVDQALALADRFNDTERGYRIPIIAAIAGEVYRIGGIDPAYPIFDQAIQETRALTSAEHQIMALGAIALAYESTGQSTQAEELLTRIQDQVSKIPDPFTSSSLLQRQVDAFIAAQQPRLALKIALLIPDENQRDYTLQNAIYEAMAAGDYGAVLSVVEVLSSPETQAQLLVQISDRYQQIGQTDQSLFFLNEALRSAQRIADPESRQLTFGVDGGTVVDDDSDRGSMYEAIAVRYAQLGRRSDAQRISGLIQEQALRDRVNQRLACW